MQEIGVDGFHGINVHLGIEFDPLFLAYLVQKRAANSKLRWGGCDLNLGVTVLLASLCRPNYLLQLN